MNHSPVEACNVHGEIPRDQHDRIRCLGNLRLRTLKQIAGLRKWIIACSPANACACCSSATMLPRNIDVSPSGRIIIS